MTARRSIHLLAILFLLCQLAALSLPGRTALAAPASTYTVDTTAESDDAIPGNNECKDSLNRCSLRAAVQEANAHPNGAYTNEIIDIPAGTYHITQKLEITDTLIIWGDGRTKTIIDGTGSSGPECFDVRADLELDDLGITNFSWGVRISSTVSDPLLVDLHGVDLYDNHSRPSVINGSAIYNGCAACTVALQTVYVYNNSSENNGGAIANYGTMNIYSSLIHDNIAANTQGGIEGNSGGGIYNYGGALYIYQSKIYNNDTTQSTTTSFGGGIYHYLGVVTIEQSEIYGNSGQEGGGVHMHSGTLHINSSLVYGNTATQTGGALYMYTDSDVPAAIYLASTVVRENTAQIDGGAIYMLRGSLVIGYSSIISNTTPGKGGALMDRVGNAFLTNTTVSGNRADRHGGAIYIEDGAHLNLANATVANNLADADDNADGKGGGVYIADAVSQLQFRNSIIAGNEDLTEGMESYAPDCFGELYSDGYNLVGVKTALCTITGHLEGVLTSVTGVPLDPKLGPLTSSGSAYYYPLLFGPAIDRGNPGGCREYGTNNLLTTDQIMHTRPYNPSIPGYTPRCDLGAIEASIARFDIYLPHLRR